MRPRFKFVPVAVLILLSVIGPAGAQENLAALGFDDISTATRARVPAAPAAPADTGDHDKMAGLMTQTQGLATQLVAARTTSQTASSALYTARAELSRLQSDLASDQAEQGRLEERQQQIPFEIEQAREAERDARRDRQRLLFEYSRARERAESATRRHDRLVGEHRSAIAADEAAQREVARLTPGTPEYQRAKSNQERLAGERGRVYHAEQEAKSEQANAESEFSRVRWPYENAQTAENEAGERISRLATETATTATKISTLSTRIDRTNSKIPSAETDVTTAKDAATTAADEVTRLERDKNTLDTELAVLQGRYLGRARTLASTSTDFTHVYGGVNGLTWANQPDAANLITGVKVNVAGQPSSVPLDQLSSDLASEYQGLVDTASGKLAKARAAQADAEAALVPLTEARDKLVGDLATARADYQVRQALWIELATARAIQDKKQREARLLELSVRPEVLALMADPRVKRDKLDQKTVDKIGEKVLVPELKDRAAKIASLDSQQGSANAAVDRQKTVVTARAGEAATAERGVKTTADFQGVVKAADKSAIQKIIDRIKALI